MTSIAASGSVPRIGFSAALLSEWTKLWTARSTYISLGLALILSIGLTALLSAVIGATIDEWSPAERAAFDPALFSFAGTLFSIILLSVLAVMFVASEYASGMIRLTLTITPQRWRVLVAKVVLVAGVSLIIGAVTTLGMFLVGQAIFASYGLEAANLGDPEVTRALIGLSLMAPVFPIIAVALGFLLRSTAGAITAVLAILFIPEIFGPLLPAWWQENVIPYLPGAASDSISIGHLDESLAYLDIGPALAVVAAWLAIFVGLAYAALARRDA